MICVNCFHKNTQVANSRGSKKYSSVWRRRKCEACKAIFSTIERPRLGDHHLVRTQDDKSVAFNLGHLALSIGSAFSHDTENGKNHALALAETVEATLISQYRGSFTLHDIEAVTHQVLRRFDEVAAIQYAASHQLMTSVRKRGRPSVVSND